MVFFFSIIFISLFSLFYIKIAKKFKIVDSPEKRSSHDYDARTGGGVIFVFSILIWFFISGNDQKYLFYGLLILSTISYIDDLYNLSKGPRLFFQIIGSYFLLNSFNFGSISIFISILFILVTVGWLNAFNFMDGINSMAGIYSLVLLTSLYYLNGRLEFADQSLIIYSIIGISIFGYFNFRNIAILFLGDVGSISIAFILFHLIISLIIHTGQISFIIMLSVFGMDSILTIIERVVKKENITEAHRSHLYQLLSNELKFNHLLVSVFYGLVQLIINWLLISSYNNTTLFQFFSLTILLVLFLGYIQIKKYTKIKIKKMIADI